MFAGIVTAVLVMPATQPIPKAEVESPKLIAKGKDFMVHSLGGLQKEARPAPLPFRAGTPAPSTEIILVHTSLDTGKMKVLIRTRGVSWQGPPMAVDRHYYTEDGVREYLADKARLYVLRYSFTADERLRPPGPEEAPGVQHTLLVFHLESGREILSKSVKLAGKAQGELFARPALKLFDNGVEVSSTRFEFQGTELLKPRDKDSK